MTTTAYDEVVQQVRRLAPEEQRRLLKELTIWTDRGTETVEVTEHRAPKRSLLGIVADLGPAPSAEEIDEARHEAWANFPRDDI